MKVFLILALSFVSRLSFAGPIIVGGAGEGEYSVIFVHKNLDAFLQDCIEFSCVLSPTQRKLLAQISESEALRFTPVFKTSRDISEIFKIRSAQNEVWISQDKLWLNDSHTVSFGVREAFQLWIRIAGAQLQLNENDISVVAELAAASLKNQVQRGAVSFASEQTFEFLLWQSGNKIRFLVRDPSLQSVNLHEYLDDKKLGCNFDDPFALTNLHIYSPTWVPLSNGGSENSLNATLHFGISWTCKGKDFNTNALFYSESVRASAQGFWAFNKDATGVWVNSNFVDLEATYESISNSTPLDDLVSGR